MSINTRTKGFSIIEILIVLIILGVLAGTALPVLTGQSEKARRAEALAALAQIRNSQLRYFQEKFTFTSQRDDLDFDFSNAGLTAGGQSVHFSYRIIGANSNTFDVFATRNTINQGDGITCISIRESGTIGDCTGISTSNNANLIIVNAGESFIVPDVPVFTINNITLFPTSKLVFSDSRTQLVLNGNLAVDNSRFEVLNGSLSDVRINVANGVINVISTGTGLTNLLQLPTITCTKGGFLSTIGSSDTLRLLGNVTTKGRFVVDGNIDQNGFNVIQDFNCS
jgi:type IV pilus assembly protein PilE